MRSKVSRSSCSLFSSLYASSNTASRPTSLLVALVLLAAVALAGPALSAQVLSRITQPLDTAQTEPLPNHRPLWANAANSTGLAPADLSLNQVTLVLARSGQQEAAFKQFLADQQNPASPDYHHWLTPAEVGQRFGLSDQDIATISSWLQSQGLQVKWVAPSRIFIGFSGAAADINRAFQTELHTYSVNGEQRFSVSSDPMIPAALAPAIKAIRGLSTIDELPLHQVRSVQSVSPQITSTGGNHYVAPADFATIYDLPSSLTGAGVTIGIVGRARTNFADFSNFRSLTGSTFPNPTEVVPTGFGGADPGPAYTAPPGGSISIDEQAEATLDVLRAGSVAPGANLVLVVATAASGGIGADVQYLVQTTPVPVQVMTISFGACELNAASGVAHWDALFQQAAAEGISTFVSSGDSGAAGCDAHGSAPPASPQPNSPNYLCSSSYATCVGGTQFADTASPSTYWSSSNGAGLLSVLSYIPEGAWNQSTSSNVAATGGGVSSVIATPSWQTGTGVPAARAGRYTPDISFTAAGHDGYFACMAAITNSSCVVSGGSFGFVTFSGTSASAPSMAGIAALLNQKLAAAQGNINPQLYAMAASTPAAFHDTTVASSGVGTCTTSTASMCNNSIPLLSGSGVQAGYALNTGYDQATGLGSLDVATFLSNFGATATLPVATTGAATSIATTAATLNGAVNPSGLDTHVWFLYGTSSTLSGATQTTSQDLGSGTSTAAATANITGLTSGATYYFQLVAQNSTGTSSGSIVSFVTNSISKTTPTVTWAAPTAITYGAVLTTTQLNATASVPGTFIYSPALGAVLTAGAQTLSVTFTPTDTTTYNSVTTTVALTVNKATPTLTWNTPAAITYGTALSSTQLNARPSVAGTFVYSPATGTVLGAGVQTLGVTFTPMDTTDYNSATGSVTLTVNKITPVITWATPSAVVVGTALSATQLNATANTAGTFVYTPALGAVMSTIGANTLSVTFTPTDTTDYTTATATVTLNVTALVPSFTVSGSAVTIASPGASTGNTSTITVAPVNGFTGSVTLTASITSSPSGAVFTPTLNFGTSSPVSITSASNGTATLTVTTTASNVASLAYPKHNGWYAGGGAALACLLFFCVPSGRRTWRNLLGMLALFFVLAGGAVACGGKSSSTTNTGSSGTTLGNYTITITGASGSTTATNTIALTVN